MICWAPQLTVRSDPKGYQAKQKLKVRGNKNVAKQQYNIFGNKQAHKQPKPLSDPILHFTENFLWFYYFHSINFLTHSAE